MTIRKQVKELLVNRSELTRSFGLNGLPIYQMTTHMPLMLDYLNRSPLRFGRVPYNNICITSLNKKGGYTNEESFRELLNSFKYEGIKNSIIGYELHSSIEIIGGHHRAVFVAAQDINSFIDIKLKSLDILDRKEIDFSKIYKAYDKVSDVEKIRKGLCYNSLPGRESIRNSIDRFKMIYEEIISCKGNHIADMGCNDGYFGINLMGHAFDVLFVDKSKAYLDVVDSKLSVLETRAEVLNKDIGKLEGESMFDITLYIDVFYHDVLERGSKKAIERLSNLIRNTKEKFIFSPGRWDKLESNNVTALMLYDLILSLNKRIKFLGRDRDWGYGRELYSIS